MNTEQQKAQNYETFKEVAEANLQNFVNGFKNELFNYRALNTHKICNLSDDEVRHLAINFFTKELAKQSFKNQEFYFDKTLIVKI